MKAGVSPIYEDGLETLIQKNYATGWLDYPADYQAAPYKDADAVFLDGEHRSR